MLSFSRFLFVCSFFRLFDTDDVLGRTRWRGVLSTELDKIKGAFLAAATQGERCPDVADCEEGSERMTKTKDRRFRGAV